jgi:hypothetical protein
MIGTIFVAAFFWSEFRLCEELGYWLDGLLKA